MKFTIPTDAKAIMLFQIMIIGILYSFVAFVKALYLQTTQFSITALLVGRRKMKQTYLGNNTTSFNSTNIFTHKRVGKLVKKIIDT